MRVTLNIWSLLCPLSPLLPSFFFSPPSHFVSPALHDSPRQKGSVELCQSLAKMHDKERTLSKLLFCFFFPSLSFRQVRVHSVDEKGERPANQYVANASPAETSGGESTGLSIVLISSAFVLHANADIRSSQPRSRLSLRAGRVEAPAYFNIGHLTDRRPTVC